MKATQLLHDLNQSLGLERDRLGLAIATRTYSSSRTPLGSPRWQRVTTTDNSMLQDDQVGVLAPPLAGASAKASEAQQLAFGRVYRMALAPGTNPGLRGHVLAARHGRGS
jgi:hypothetical protein